MMMMTLLALSLLLPMSKCQALQLYLFFFFLCRSCDVWTVIENDAGRWSLFNDAIKSQLSTDCAPSEMQSVRLSVIVATAIVIHP